MSTTTLLLDRWMKLRKIDTDAAAASELGLTKGSVYNWRERDGNAEIHIVERMAKDLGEDPATVIIEVFKESQRSDEAKKTLQRLAKRLTGTSLLVLALACPMRSEAQTVGFSAHPVCAVYIMRSSK